VKLFDLRVNICLSNAYVYKCRKFAKRTLHHTYIKRGHWIVGYK